MGNYLVFCCILVVFFYNIISFKPDCWKLNNFKAFLLIRPNRIFTEDCWGDDINIAAFSNLVKFISLSFLAKNK